MMNWSYIAGYFDGEGHGLSYSGIAAKLGVQTSAVAQAFRRRGIPARPAGGALMRGVPKSEETRRRMKASRQKLWANPTFRAQQLANLSRTRMNKSAVAAV
jgi:hypothetical protein